MQLNMAPKLAVLCGVLAWFGGHGAAGAYPQFQLATGNTRCNLCHVSPSGGGLITSYGRDEAEGTISSTAGNSKVFHGLWEPPSWLMLGGDYRGVGMFRQAEGRSYFLGFPMQLDLYTRLVFGKISVNATVGMTGAAREPRRSPLGRVASREHYVMWQPEETGLYARAGRFMVPYGLRLQDHTAYIRRFLGQHTLEETYNVSVGKVEDAWEVHATAFVPTTLLKMKAVGTPGLGAALLYERRFREDTASYGMQSKIELAEETRDVWLGGLGKLWLEEQKLLFLSELDVGLQTFAFDADPRLELAAHVGITYFLRQGWLVGTMLEHFDPDVMLGGTERDSVNLSVQYFFRSHWELMLMGKVDLQGFGSPDPMFMLMLHYYL